MGRGKEKEKGNGGMNGARRCRKGGCYTVNGSVRPHEHGRVFRVMENQILLACLS